jgi:hypothetical protein
MSNAPAMTTMIGMPISRSFFKVAIL